MKNHWVKRIGGLAAVVILITVAITVTGQAAPTERPLQAPIGTDFTYQGYLEDGGLPANGTYNMRFSLFNGPESYATQVGPTVSLASVEVVDGYFTVELDFGDVPWNTGLEMFLQIAIYDIPPFDYVTLSPRQKIGPVPYAVYADYADNIPLGGDGVAETAAHSDHTHFGETWDAAGSIGFRVVNSSMTTGATALSGVASNGSGTNIGVYGQTDSAYGLGGSFQNAGGGVAAYFLNDGTDPTVHLYNQATNGAVLHLQNSGVGASGTGGGLFIEAVNEANDDIQFHVGTDGSVYSDVGYHCGMSIEDGYLFTNPPVTTVQGLGEAYLEPCLKDEEPADFAEMLPGQGELSAGDVLVVSLDGSLILSSEAYQTTVVGVHSYQPSYLGNAQFVGQDDYVPLAMMGVVPVKASAENGAITPGDLLVASNTPGHAMRAGENPPQGTVIGKALSPLEAGTGYIKMIVTLQ